MLNEQELQHWKDDKKMIIRLSHQYNLRTAFYFFRIRFQKS